MAIVWHTHMTAREYAAAGDDLQVPRPCCGDCAEAMIFWGSYVRPVRVADAEFRLRIRRALCKKCRSSHALIPDLLAPGRLDIIEVIGHSIGQMADGATAAASARSTGLPYTTVRDWRRRFVSRAQLLAAGFFAATVALGDLVPRMPADTVSAAVCAIGAAARAFRRRFGVAGGDWRLANLIVGGHLISANSEPPWIAA